MLVLMFIDGWFGFDFVGFCLVVLFWELWLYFGCVVVTLCCLFACRFVWFVLFCYLYFGSLVCVLCFDFVIV